MRRKTEDKGEIGMIKRERDGRDERDIQEGERARQE